MKKNFIYAVLISILFIGGVTLYQYSRYVKIMSDQRITVCKMIRLTDKYSYYKFMVDSVEYESRIGVRDPDTTHKVGTYYLLLYYPKNPKINSIIYQEVRDSSGYGKSVHYPHKVKVYFWRF